MWRLMYFLLQKKEVKAGPDGLAVRRMNEKYHAASMKCIMLLKNSTLYSKAMRLFLAHTSALVPLFQSVSVSVRFVYVPMISHAGLPKKCAKASPFNCYILSGMDRVREDKIILFTFPSKSCLKIG